MTKEHTKKRISLETGKTYTNHNGADYLCLYSEDNSTAIMERIKDGWRLIAHGICQYDDDTIEWDYSTNGHFKR